MYTHTSIKRATWAHVVLKKQNQWLPICQPSAAYLSHLSGPLKSSLSIFIIRLHFFPQLYAFFFFFFSDFLCLLVLLYFSTFKQIFCPSRNQLSNRSILFCLDNQVIQLVDKIFWPKCLKIKQNIQSLSGAWEFHIFVRCPCK